MQVPAASPPAFAALSLIEHDLFGKPVSTFPDHALAVIDRNRLGRCKAVEGFKALLTAVARTLDAADRRFGSAAAAVVVDEDLSRVNGARQAELPPTVAGPDSADKAKGRTVRQIDRLLLAVEGHDDLDRPEDLLLHEAMAGRNVADQRRRDIGA